MRQSRDVAAGTVSPAEIEATPRLAGPPESRETRHAVARHGQRPPFAGASAIETSWMTPRQAAAYFGVGVDAIYEACATDALKHVKLGYRTIRVRREWIDAWAESLARPSA